MESKKTKQSKEPTIRRERGRGLRSMRFIVTFISVLLISASVLSVGLLGQKRLQRILIDNGRSQLLLETRNLAYLSSDALLDNYPELILQPLVQEIAAKHSEMAFVVVTDYEGRIRGHVDVRQLGKIYVGPIGLKPVGGVEDLRTDEQLTGKEDLLVATALARGGKGQEVGAVQVGMNLSELQAILAAERSQQLLLVVLLLGCGCLAAMLVMTRLLKPLKAITNGLDRIGAGNLDSPIKVKSRTELGSLAGHINRMSIQLKTAQDEAIQQERLSHEMDLARSIQESLLPAKQLDLEQFHIYGDQKPAFEVGGDFYDVFWFADGRVGLFIADVAGKGLAGCLATSMLASYLRAYRELPLSPEALLDRIEVQLKQTLPRGTFVTAFYGLLDPLTGELEFASAGHHPPLIFRSATKELQWVKASGTPLAILRGSRRLPPREVRTLTLAPGDILLQMTDGIDEARAPSGEQFGLDRVAEVVAQSAGAGGAELMTRLLKAVADWGGGMNRMDDETLLIVHREAEYASSHPDDDAINAEHSEVLRVFASACHEGEKLTLSSNIDSLRGIHDWLRDCPGVEKLTRDDLAIINTALVDACANIIEHGELSKLEGGIELFWIPGADGPRGSFNPGEAPFDDAIREASGTAGGKFLIRDDAKPFDPRGRGLVDMKQFKETGRGLGLKLLDTAAWRIAYAPATRQGNLTLLQFNPIKFRKNKEAIDA